MRLRLFCATLSASILLATGVFAQGQGQANFAQPGYVQGSGPGEGGFPPPEYVNGAPMGHPGMQPNMQQPNMPPQNMQQPMMQGAPMQGPGMMPGQGMPNAAYQQGFGNSQPPVAAQKIHPQQAAKVYQWFLKYDEIRRRAQMDPIEKQRADGLLARGFGLFMPGQDKIAAKQLLSTLVAKYQSAAQSLQGLPPLKDTQQLQELYYQYFDTAMHLFSDYLKVQDNVFAVDNTGQSIAKQLIQRKLQLENLERACKDLDYRMRQTYGVAPYQF